MSKGANKKLIGAFVVGAVVLLVIGLSIFGSGKIFKKTVPVVFYFKGSVKGLGVGSPVVIRGVEVGSVTEVDLVYNAADMSIWIPVYAEFDPEKVTRIGGGIKKTPGERREEITRLIVDRGLRAQLQIQSMVTGQLVINVDFMPDTPINLLGKDPHVLEIPTIPTPLEAFTERLQKIPVEKMIEQVGNTIEGMDRMVNSPEMQEAAKKLSQNMDELRGLIRSVNAEVKPLSAGMQDTLREARSLIKNADQAVQNVDREVEPLASRVKTTLQTTQELAEEFKAEVGPAISDLKKTLEQTRASLAQAQRTLEEAESNYAEGSAFHHELTETLEGVTEASRSFQNLADYMERHPNSVIWGKGKPRR
ncbi:MAG TPA: MlaD family protein [Candidatus Acidoferrum sp.]|nr:MlaD family protein [Candidatus Acidoferrum sp.]